MVRSAISLFFLGFLGSAAALAAATAGVSHALREWHTQDGLPGEELSRVLQARDGFLWLAGPNGIVQFDGARFEHRVFSGNVSGLPSLARALAETPAAGLVVAPTAGGLQTWRDGRFAELPLPGAAGRVFTVLFGGRDGALWAAGEDGAVLRWDGRQTQTFATLDGLNGRAVISLANDAAGNTWLVNGTHLYRHDGATLAPVNLAGPRVELRIGSSAAGGPWLVAHDRLLKGTGTGWAEQARLPDLVGAHHIQALLEDRAGTLWIGTRSQGLFVFQRDGLRRVETSHDDILGLTADADGNIWVATNGGGLNRLRPRVFKVFDRGAGLRDNFSDTVCEDRDGRIWFGNRDGGLAWLRPDGTVAQVPAPGAWPDISVVSVAPHPDGGVWVTAGPGLFRVDRRTPPELVQWPAPRLPIIRCTLVARDGSLWFSAEPERIGRLVAGRFEFFGREAGYDGRQIRFLAEDPAGGIWCGTASGQLFRREGAGFVRVELDGPSGSINAIYVEADGTLWLGTSDRGLLVRRGGTWRALTNQQGLPDNHVTQILADDRGNFWCGSARGIFRVRRSDLLASWADPAARIHAVLLGKDEGLRDISCLGFFQPAAWRARDGSLWFTTRRGVLQLDPERALPEAPPPSVRIGELRCDQQPAARTAGIELQAGFRKLEIPFSVLCLSTPERVNARFRLDGFDADWITAGADHVATYPQLPPGDYRFRVVAGLGGISGDQSEDMLLFTVVPLWWQSWWLRAGLVMVAGVGVTWWVRAWSHRRLRLRLEKLERQGAIERERTRIAQNIHDDLGASLTRISLLTQSQTGDPAPGGLLERIYATAVEATRAMDEIVWAVNPKYDDLDSLASYLGNFAQDFLGAAGIRCRLDVPGCLPATPLTSQIRHHLFLCCKEALHNVVKHAAATEVTITLRTEGANLTLAITDNGRGIPSSGTLRDPRRIVSGQGLENMASRLAAMQGRCELRPGAGGRGTTVVFTLPYHFAA